MQMLKHCLNWKVITGLGVVGVGIYAVAPGLAVAALPFLLLAICPLSMMFMMKGMGQNQDGERQASEEAEAGLTRGERLARLREQQATLTGRIADLEQEEPQTTRNGRGR